MSQLKHQYKKAAMGMVGAMLCASMLYEVIESLDISPFPLVAHALPLGLSEAIGVSPLLTGSFFMGLVFVGVLMAILPAAVSQKRTLLCGLCLLLFSTASTLLARSLVELVCWRFVFGMGWSLHFCAWLSLAVAYFPRHGVMIVACMNAIMAAAAIVGDVLLPVIFEHAGWHDFLPVSLACMLVLALLYVLTSYLFEQAAADDRWPVLGPDAPGVRASVWSAGPLLLILAVVCMILAEHAIFPAYFHEAQHVQGFSASMAILVSKVSLLAAFLSPVAAWLGARHGVFKVFTITAPLAGILGALLFLGENLSWIALLPLIFLLSFGVKAVLHVHVLAAVIDSVVPAHRMRVLGLFSAAFYLPHFFTCTTVAHLQGKLGWRSGAALQVLGCLLLAGVLVWLAQKALRRSEHRLACA